MNAPGPRPVRAAETFSQLVVECARRFGDKTFLPRRSSRGGDPVTFAQLAADARRAAAGLCALGIGRGDRIALLAENCYQWLLVDLAASSIGAVDVPRGGDTAPSEMQFILQHSGCRLAFAENDRIARAVLDARAELPDLEGVLTLQDATELADVTPLPDLLARGDAWLVDHASELDQRAAAVQADDLLTIVYTSGTTAEPKGVMLTHGNVISNVAGADEVLDIGPSDRFLSILPAWHMYERMMCYTAFAAGSEIYYTDRRQMKADLAAARPTIFAGVPRLWELIHDGIVGKCEKMSGLGRGVMRGVLRVARRVGSGRHRFYDRALHALLRATVLRRFQAVTGGRLRIAVSGGGALPAHVDETLLGLGFPLLNGYGLTETSPVVAVRRPHANRCGTIGPPMPRTEIEIRDFDGHPLPQGEIGVIWIRGPQVMRGYYKNDERTRRVLDPEGWFNSGDLGCVLADGQVRITGRAKDTIVLAGGENVEPEPLETVIKTSALIEQAVVVGQDRKTLGALLVPHEDCLEEVVARARWDVRDGLVRGEDVHRALRRELDRLVSPQHGFRPCERISTFRVLAEPLTPENGMLTATLKVKRHVVQERLGELIEAMFAR